MDDLESQTWMRVGVAAALSRQYAQDQQGLLDQLALMLEEALGEEASILRRGGLFSRKAVSRISLRLGDDRYTLERSGQGALTAARTRVVRGIALKTEEISVEAWLETLGTHLEERARSHASIREALARFVG